MADTYAAKPFISHDGMLDGIRAEVQVVKGRGNVIAVVPSAKGVSHQIEFSVENTKYNPKSWTRDSRLIEMAKAALEAGEALEFRQETRRKDGIDRSLPIDDIRGLATAKDSIVKSLAALKRDDDSEWTLSQDAVTRFDEDPQGGGPVSAIAQTEEQLGRNKTTATPSGGKRGFESLPFATFNGDGSLNVGSVAVGVPSNFFIFILEQEKAGGLTISKDDRKATARIALQVANRLQKAVYKKYYDRDLETPDFSAGSHTRARGLVFEAIKHFFPLTEEIAADETARAAWAKSLYGTGLAMWEWAIEETREIVG